VFFPPAPDKPRLQFLTSYSGGEDFDADKGSFLETFVLGEAEKGKNNIVKPYGVAIYDSKIYVCDVGQNVIKVMDIANNKFELFPSGRSVQMPMCIFIDSDGTKYVSDVSGGVVVVFNSEDKLKGYIGKDQGMRPLDVFVQGSKLYVTDVNSDEVLVFDKNKGKLLQRFGKDASDEANSDNEDRLMITGVTLDEDGNIYVSDKLVNRVVRHDPEGKRVGSYGRGGSAPDSLIRAKGVAVDKEKRVWVVDAGPATAVKVYSNEGQILMLFGFLGKQRGEMYIPADILIDYDHVDLFEKYAVDGAELEFIVLVTNQFGPHKVSVYGFGEFPDKYTLSFDDRGDDGDESAAGDEGAGEEGDETDKAGADE
jgi:DNA-binding beta-propeller fold protein YncE